MFQALLRRTLFVLTLVPAAIPGIGVADGPGLTLTTDTSSPLIPTRVRSAWTERGLELSGRIEKRHNGYGRIIGHVAIDLLDAGGQVIGCHAGALQGFFPSRRNPDWASFRTVLRTVPPGLAGLRVRYAVGCRC